MAQPDRSPAALAQIIHEQDAGYKVGPFTLQSKTVTSQGVRLIVVAVCTRGPNTWTATYTTDQDGNLGKIYSVWDESGQSWLDRLNDWVAG